MILKVSNEAMIMVTKKSRYKKINKEKPQLNEAWGPEGGALMPSRITEPSGKSPSLARTQPMKSHGLFLY